MPFDSPKYGDCYIMVNEMLDVYEVEDSPGRPDDGRYLCLFVHRGNYVRNFRGCIGASHNYKPTIDMLQSSTRAACEEVNWRVNEEGSHQLRII